MTASAPRDALVRALDEAVEPALAYFAGPGRDSSARVDRWGARDVLAHFLYYHEATAWGIQSAALGGPVWPVPADADHVNEVCRRLHEHESLDALLEQARLAHAQLRRAAAAAPDLDRPCFRRATGELLTGRQRLDGIARHWSDHLHALQAAAGA